MKSLWRMVIGLSVLTLLASCSSSYEGKGNQAYSLAQKASGDEKRIQQKTAYIMYQRAIKNHPTTVKAQTKQRFVELSLVRAYMVLNEGSAHNDAIPLYMQDIDSNMTPDMGPDVKQQYALFVAQLADSNFTNSKFDEAIAQINKAISVASDQAPIQEKKNQMIGRVAKDNYDMAEMELAQGKENKDPEDLIRAEYHVSVTLYFDPNFPNAAKMLSDLRKENKGTYSAYLKVIETIDDSTVFKKINKYDILLAIPTIDAKGGNTSMLVNIYNFSYNPLRMKSESFYALDAEGKRYQASMSKIEPEILDQEHETKCKLSFPLASGKIVKVIYDNGEQYSEKCFL